MSDTSNPFSAPEARSRSGVAGSIIAWSMAVIALGAAVLFFTLRTKENAAHQREKEVLREELDKTAADLFHAVATLQTNSEYIVYLTNQISALAKEKEFVGQRAKTLEEEMREQLESKDVTISKLQGRLTVTIVDRVMFDSGEAVLKPDGAAVMQKIADLLASHPELKIHVIGHTDNV
jgi:chemotaxis protein MotB